jgi:hypothetical protein
VARQHDELRGSAVLHERRLGGGGRAGDDAHRAGQDRHGKRRNCRPHRRQHARRRKPGHVGAQPHRDGRLQDQRRQLGLARPEPVQPHALRRPDADQRRAQARRQRQTRDIPQRFARCREPAFRHDRAGAAIDAGARVRRGQCAAAGQRGHLHRRRGRQRSRRCRRGRRRERPERHLRAEEDRYLQPAMPAAADGRGQRHRHRHEYVDGRRHLLQRPSCPAPRRRAAELGRRNRDRQYRRRRLQRHRPQPRGHLLPAPADPRSAAGEQARHLRAVRGCRRHLQPHRYGAWRLEGAGRHRGQPAGRARPRHQGTARQPYRRRQRAAQPGRHQRAARAAGDRQRDLGCAHARRRRRARLAMEVCAGAPACSLHRGEPVPRYSVGGVRAQ